jgi:hypothetical protein
MSAVNLCLMKKSVTPENEATGSPSHVGNCEQVHPVFIKVRRHERHVLRRIEVAVLGFRSTGPRRQDFRKKQPRGGGQPWLHALTGLGALENPVLYHPHLAHGIKSSPYSVPAYLPFNRPQSTVTVPLEFWCKCTVPVIVGVVKELVGVIWT